MYVYIYIYIYTHTRISKEAGAEHRARPWQHPEAAGREGQGPQTPVHGQFSKVKSGNIGPAPGIFELSRAF